MIARLPQSWPSAASEVVCRRVLALISGSGACPSERHADAFEQVAESVAQFVGDRADDTPVTDRALLALTVRALAGAGFRPLAGQVLLVSGGCATPHLDAVWGGGRCWVLDLDRWSAGSVGELELAVLVALGRLLGTLAPAWDTASGVGALGLRGVDALAARVVGCAECPRARARAAGEIRSACADRLKGLARERGWTRPPLLVEVDGLQPRGGRPGRKMR